MWSDAGNSKKGGKALEGEGGEIGVLKKEFRDFEI